MLPDGQPTHRILVVEDEPDIAGLVAYHLAKAGYRVTTAANGTEALKVANVDRPDLVVLDRDYLTLPADQIKDIQPTMTMVGGKIAWDASAR